MGSSSEKALELTWDNIANVPVADASSVADWNTFFDLPTNGTPFTSVEVTGNTVSLFGGSNITLKDSLFLNNSNLISFIDNAESVAVFDVQCFQGCSSATNFYLPLIEIAAVQSFMNCTSATSASFNLPIFTTAEAACFQGCNLVAEFNFELLQSAGNACFNSCLGATVFNLPSLTTAMVFCFEGCTSATTFYLPLCASMGEDPTDATVFNNIVGKTITITIPASLMTANAGAPHASIQYLIDNNDVQIITV